MGAQERISKQEVGTKGQLDLGIKNARQDLIDSINNKLKTGEKRNPEEEALYLQSITDLGFNPWEEEH